MGLLTALRARRSRPSTTVPAPDNETADDAIEQMLVDGNNPAAAAPALAEMADIEIPPAAVETITAEEFRNRYRPRIKPVAEQLIDAMSATVDAVPVEAGLTSV